MRQVPPLSDPTWATIVGSRLAAGADLRVLGERELAIVACGAARRG
ncbi:MAG: hypothetical protein ACLP52_24560 [Streptosporangiaceae bacterium]